MQPEDGSRLVVEETAAPVISIENVRKLKKPDSKPDQVAEVIPIHREGKLRIAK